MITRMRCFGWTILFQAGALAACGSGSEGGPGGGTATIAKAPAPNGDGQGGTVAQALPDSFRVRVTEDGAPRAGVTVSWTSTVAGAVLNPATSVSDANGLAASRMTLGTAAGSQAARAGIGSGNPVTFNVTAAPGPAASLVVVAGNEQAALAGTALTGPLQVRVSDQFGNPVPGSTVTWEVTAGDASPSAGSSTTNAAGLAAITVTAGNTVGAVEVQAVSGQDTVTFSAHVVSLVKDVLVKNNFFESVSNGSQAPSVDTIPAGEAVRWIWQSAAVDHNIIPQGPLLFQGVSGAIPSPFTWGPIRITQPGTYNYDCNLHTGMSGILVVQ